MDRNAKIYDVIDHCYNIRQSIYYDYDVAAPTETAKASIIRCLEAFKQRGCLRFWQKVGLFLLQKG